MKSLCRHRSEISVPRAGAGLAMLGRVSMALGAYLLIASASGARAATYYVDGNCPTRGTGISPNCGSAGPVKTVEDGLTLLTAPGDVLQVRGVHGPHDGETAAFDGRYFADYYPMIDKHGSASGPIVIQPYQYSGPGTGETVYLDGTTAPSSGWTKCSSCGTGTGVCGAVPTGACSETWYATDGGLAGKVVGAQKDDGTPTYRVSSPSDLTNAHSGYAGTPPEIDSYSPQTAGGTILVRWGSTLPSKPYVFYNNNGMGFYFKNSSHITVRGFRFRCHVRAGATPVDSSDIIIDDNRIFYSSYTTLSGPDYGIASYSSTRVTISNNEIGWTTSEGIHTRSMAVGPTVVIIRGNWIHDTGNVNVLGPASLGTPSGLILTSDYTATDGNHAGSIVENNFIEKQANHTPGGGSQGRGLILEDNTNNWVIRNNVFYRSTAECLKFDGTGISTNGNQIYNNLFVECGQDPGPAGGGGPGIYAVSSGVASVSNNKIYNNTFVNNRNGGMVAECGGPCSGNEIRNNIMYDSNAKRMMNWPTGAIFTHNVVFSPTTGTLLAINGNSLSCQQTVPTADVDGNGTAGDNVRCSDPLFTSLSGRDYHLLASSPALDVGTTTGMPPGRTVDIANTLASLHGFASYAGGSPMSGSAWDVGAVERSGGSVSGPTASLVVSGSSPLGPGSYLLTLQTSSPVVSLPGPLSFGESDGTSTGVTLSGTVPGSVFSGTFVVDASVADGTGLFGLPLGNLLDASGNSGNSITSGAQITVDKAPPAVPANLHFSY